MSTGYFQEFHCDNCKVDVKEFVWSDDIQKNKLPKHSCGKKLKIIIRDEPNESPTIGGKFKHGRNPKEARARSDKHFQKEILPYLPRAEKQHFRKKGLKPL